LRRLSPRLRHAGIAALAAVLCAALIVGGSNLYLCASGAHRITTVAQAPAAQCILVLGAGVRDGQPTLMLRDRLDTALALCEAGVADRILVSGDHGQRDYDEVNVMRTYLVQRGVPVEAVFMDHAGFDTYSTMVRAKEVFCVQSAVVVTQQYHLYRALFNARCAGIDAYGVDCTVYESYLLPYYKLREAVARTKDFFIAGIFRPAPKYLGPQIPITGDGRVTEG